MTTLSHEFRWDAATAKDGECATWGCLRVMLGARQVWGAAEGASASGIRWTWIDLLEFLAASWPWIVGEHGWPPNVLRTDMNPADFDTERRRALEQAESKRARVETVLFDFRERHDLSRALHGKIAPRLWVVRQGQMCWIGGRDPSLRAWSEVSAFLVRLGEDICDRVKAHADERSVLARTAWRERDVADAQVRAEAVTGLSGAELRVLLGTADPAKAFDLGDKGYEPTELAVAARLAAPSIATKTVRSLLKVIRSTPVAAPDGALGQLSGEAERFRDQGLTAFDQGASLALWLRECLDLASEAKANPKAILTSWRVHVAEIDLDDRGIDGVACWGPRHGPAVYVNTSGLRARGTSGRRATLAHEIAHLLIDRHGALPLADITGALHRGQIEQRANAFAAEFLAPRSAVGPAFAACKTAPEAREKLKELGKTYGASGEILAWQALHSEASLRDPVRRALAMQVPPDRQWQFFSKPNE